MEKALRPRRALVQRSLRVLWSFRRLFLHWTKYIHTYICMELHRSDGMWQQLDIFLISKCETRDGTNALCDDTLFPAASHLWALFTVVLPGKQQGRLHPNMVQKSHVPRKNSNEYIPYCTHVSISFVLACSKSQSKEWTQFLKMPNFPLYVLHQCTINV